MIARGEVNSWHVATSAEAFAAGQFARLGWDVSVQYGANQPEYDLIVASADRMMKISVKGTQRRAWGLTQSYLKNANYHQAADKWLGRHSKATVLCLVQFYARSLNELPLMFLATPKEIAQELKAMRGGLGSTALWDSANWVGGRAVGVTDRIPEHWAFSKERVDDVYNLIKIA